MISSAPLPGAARVRKEPWWESRVARRFRRNTLAMLGLAIMVLFALMAAFAPLLAPPEQACARDLGIVKARVEFDQLEFLACDVPSARELFCHAAHQFFTDSNTTRHQWQGVWYFQRL